MDTRKVRSCGPILEMGSSREKRQRMGSLLSLTRPLEELEIRSKPLEPCLMNSFMSILFTEHRTIRSKGSLLQRPRLDHEVSGLVRGPSSIPDQSSLVFAFLDSS